MTDASNSQPATGLSLPLAAVPPSSFAGPPPLSGMISMVAAWTLWSMDPILIYLIGSEMPRLYLAGITLLAGGLVMAWAGRSIVKKASQLKRQHLLMLTALVVCSTALADLLYVSAITLMNPGLVSVVLRSQIAFAVILAMLFLGERFGRITLAGIVIIIIANLWMVVVAIVNHGGGGQGSLWGWVMALGAAILWSLGTILCKQLVQVMRPIELVVARLALAGILLVVVSIVIYGIEPLRSLSGRQWGLLGLKGFITSGLTFFLYFWGLRRLQVYVASALEQVAPLISLLVAHFYLRELVTAGQVLFVGVLLGGSFIIIIGSRHERINRLPLPTGLPTSGAKLKN